MKPYTPTELNLLIARAKTAGDQIWYHIKALDTLAGDTKENSYDRFAGMCDAYSKEFLGKDIELGNLLGIEMFLRAGKHLPPKIKIHNRKTADALKEAILRRK